jgi:hypothetical protein
MQPNQITLAVDTENTGVTTDKVYLRFEETLNRSTYVSDTHTYAEKDTVTLYRTLPKQNGNFKGVLKSSLKVTEDFSVPGVDSSTTLTSPVILSVSFSVPIGVTSADLLRLRQTVIALLDQDTLMNPLNHQLMI